MRGKKAWGVPHHTNTGKIARVCGAVWGFKTRVGLVWGEEKRAYG